MVHVHRCMSDCHKREALSYLGPFKTYDEVINSDDVILPAVFQQLYGRHLVIAYASVSFIAHIRHKT